MKESTIRDLAMEMAARGRLDYRQFFTSPLCEVLPPDKGEKFYSVQVWVIVSKKELKEMRHVLRMEDEEV